MQFGKISPTQIPFVDFRLPPDPTENKMILGGKKSNNLVVKLGCSKWGVKEWIGKYYPEKTKQKDLLAAYGKLFDAVELSPTHYKIPSAEQVLKWKDQTPRSFRFCPKIFQGISHWDRLRNVEQRTTDFCESVMNFGTQLGTNFLQLPPNFNTTNGIQLFDFIKKWPREIPLAIELRHQDWYTHAAKELFDQLFEVGISTVITDTAGRRDLLHMRLTTRQAFVRFVGNGLETNDVARINDWIARIKAWQNLGLESLYFFVHQHDSHDSPKLIEYMAKKLSLLEGIDLNKPSFESVPFTLF